MDALIAGADNLIDERIAYANANNLSPRIGAAYREANAPWRKVWHTTEVTPSSLAGVRSMAIRHRNPPHLWADPRFDWVGQTVPLDLSAYALLHQAGDPETNHAHAIQTEVIGFAGSGPLRGEVADWLGRRVLAPILEADVPIDIHLVAPSTGSNGAGVGGAVRQSWAWWHGFDGQCGHANVPGNVHWDPGVADYARIAQAAVPIPPPPSPIPSLEDDGMFAYDFGAADNKVLVIVSGGKQTRVIGATVGATVRGADYYIGYVDDAMAGWFKTNFGPVVGLPTA